MKVARIYLRVSTDEQDLTRQADIERNTRSAGYYIAGVYREKASALCRNSQDIEWLISLFSFIGSQDLKLCQLISGGYESELWTSCERIDIVVTKQRAFLESGNHFSGWRGLM